ncbi:NAD(P)-binding protein [Ascodesmis nigricans]|uniref:3-oxoacyl-[acyl-carrier-protein] reductase n=1 Tax=Ascodesmis nigricans TaxID=341454 RepID=A0A4S2MW44_9PEZI|nr:NAD(P)-binding protein [Ascodesmis nigricans]
MSESETPQKPQTLAGRFAIVIGATRGIGYSITTSLLSHGCSVLGTYNISSSISTTLESLAPTLSPTSRFHGLQASILDLTSPARILAAVQSHFPSQAVDILVLNAAIATLSPLDSLTIESYQSVITGNQLFPALLVQTLLPVFSTTGTGRIIAISSEGASLSRPNTTEYSATKAALESMVRTWSKELGRRFNGLTVNAVAPGLVKTDLWMGLAEERRRVWEEKAREGTVSGKVGEAGDVAEVVVWLAGEGSRWVTGTTVAVNGGMYDL